MCNDDLKEGDLVRLTEPDTGSGYDEYTAILVEEPRDSYVFPHGGHITSCKVLHGGKVMDVDATYWTVSKVK